MAGGEMSPVSLMELLSLLGANDIFEIITDAIAVAAHDHPHELEQRRDSILQMLDAAKASGAAAAAAAADETALVSEKVDDGTKNQPAGDENGSAISDEALPVSEQVARINSLLVGEGDGWPSSDEAVLLKSLRALKAVRMTFETLESTKIGRAVSGLRKHASEQVRGLAGDLYKGWKALADEHFRNVKAKTAAPKPMTTSKPSSPNQENPPAGSRETPKVVERVRNLLPTSAGSATNTKAATRQPKPSCSSACERKEAPTSVIDEAGLATAKRRLHDGYEEAATVKKQRRIQIISAPEKTRQRPEVRHRLLSGRVPQV